MKTLLSILMVLLCLSGSAQQTNRLQPNQALPLRLWHPYNLLSVDTNGTDKRIYAIAMDSILIGFVQTKWVKDSTINWGNTRWMKLSAAMDTIANMRSSVNSKASKATTISINGVSHDLASNASFTVTPDQTVSLSPGYGISITGTYPNFTITNTYKPSINLSPGRSLNSSYTPSATRPTIGVYTVTCSTTNPLLLGTSSATVYAEYSTNGGSTWNAISSNGSSNGVGVTVTVQLQVGQVSTLVVPISEGWLVRLRTATTGTASVVLTEQKELNI